MPVRVRRAIGDKILKHQRRTEGHLERPGLDFKLCRLAFGGQQHFEVLVRRCNRNGFPGTLATELQLCIEGREADLFRFEARANGTDIAEGHVARLSLAEQDPAQTLFGDDRGLHFDRLESLLVAEQVSGAAARPDRGHPNLTFGADRNTVQPHVRPRHQGEVKRLDLHRLLELPGQGFLELRYLPVERNQMDCGQAKHQQRTASDRRRLYQVARLP
jgi:hypothetical protein